MHIDIGIEGVERGPDRNGLTLWSKDRMAVVMPTPQPSWGPEIKRLYAMRLQANFTGVCPSCKATNIIEGVAPNQGRSTMEHEHDCQVSDDLIEKAWRHGR